MKSPPSCLVLSETWLGELNKDLFNIDGYECYNTIRSEKRSGGVSAYIAESFFSWKVEELSECTGDIESCVTGVSVSKTLNLFIVSIYRPVSGNCDIFFK